MPDMKKRFIFFAVVMLAFHLRAETNALVLVKTIPLPDVAGRIDHFTLDARGQRLFMAALGNDTVEVLDLAADRRIKTIGGCSTPQGVAFAPLENRLLIANGGSGVVQMLAGDSLQPLHEIKGLPDADNVRYANGRFYVGYGDGALAIINATNGELLASIKLDGHPESFQLERDGSRIFVNVPDAGEIEVVDRSQGTVVAKAKSEFGGNFPMALDEAGHRLFIGCRHPARLLVWDTTTLKKIGEAKISSDTDDVFYDVKRQQIYVSCGGGFLDVIDAGNYEVRQRIPTVAGARTGFFVPERDEFYLAVRAGLISGKAEVRIFKCR